MEASSVDRGKHLVKADGRFLLGGGFFARLLAPGFELGLDRIDKGLAQGTMDATLPDGRIRRLGGRLPDDGVKGRASPSGVAAGAGAAEAMAAAILAAPVS